MVGKLYVITAKNPEIIVNLELANELEKRAFIRGIFMGSGSINNPENKYHLEIKLNDNELSQGLITLLKQYGINVKSIEKAIYIKDSEEISKFLAFIGANKSVLEFEQIRVQREMNNKINRLVNCKTANLNKTINASVEQINAIKKLKENGKFKKMDKSLQELLLILSGLAKIKPSKNQDILPFVTIFASVVRIYYFCVEMLRKSSLLFIKNFLQVSHFEFWQCSL